jgi:hypothetical protein
MAPQDDRTSRSFRVSFPVADGLRDVYSTVNEPGIDFHLALMQRQTVSKAKELCG